MDAKACAEIVAAAERSDSWNSTRHTDYATTDIEVSTIAALHEWLVPKLQSTLLPTMAALFEIPLCRLLAREIFVVKYSTEAGGQPALSLYGNV